MQNIDLLVRNARMVSPDTQTVSSADTAIAVDDGKILDIGSYTRLSASYFPAKTMDAAGKYLFPGLINTHNHLFQVLTKGLGKERLLWDWLVSTIRQMSPFISEEAIYYAALAGCLENIRSGCTTLLDFQYCHSRQGHFDAVCQAFRDSGIRGYVGRIQYGNDYYGYSKVPMEDDASYFSNISRLVSAQPDRAMLDVAMVAPGIPGILDAPCHSSGYLREMREVAMDLKIPYTQHLVETDDDDQYMLEKTGETSIEFLNRSQFFSKRCILAHCVKMKEPDFAVFREYDVKVSHNPVSNMILASGISPIKRFLQEGICVSLATDGSGSNDSQDMLETLKFANLLQKVSLSDATALTAAQTLQMATLGGARALERPDLGSLEIGKRADFFLYNPSQLKSAPVSDPISSLIYCSGECNIHTVVVNGRVLLENGLFTAVNEGKTIEMLEKCACEVRRCAAAAPPME